MLSNSCTRTQTHVHECELAYTNENSRTGTRVRELAYINLPERVHEFAYTSSCTRVRVRDFVYSSTRTRTRVHERELVYTNENSCTRTRVHERQLVYTNELVFTNLCSRVRVREFVCTSSCTRVLVCLHEFSFVYKSLRSCTQFRVHEFSFVYTG